MTNSNKRYVLIFEKKRKKENASFSLQLDIIGIMFDKVATFWSRQIRFCTIIPSLPCNCNCALNCHIKTWPTGVPG